MEKSCQFHGSAGKVLCRLKVLVTERRTVRMHVTKAPYVLAGRETCAVKATGYH